MKMWRQGDVLILAAEKPRQMMKRAGDNILVYGEATGHSHKAEGAAVYDHQGQKFVQAMNEWSLTHEEHATIQIPEGFYRVVRQREFDENQIRYVAD